MSILLDSGVIWWITAIDIPAMVGLFWLFWNTKKTNEIELNRMQKLVDQRHAQMRDSLSTYKLEVAKSYTSIGDARELEKRLVNHLLRIEAKLDVTALKTASLKH